MRELIWQPNKLKYENWILSSEYRQFPLLNNKTERLPIIYLNNVAFFPSIVTRSAGDSKKYPRQASSNPGMKNHESNVILW